MSRSQALVLAGHGSQRHPRSASPLHAHADRIRDSSRFDEVRTAFWKEEPTLRDVRSIVESEIAYVVPVLTSEGYFADGVFPRELGIGRGESDAGTSATDGPEVRYAEPVGTHDALTSVIEARIESAVDGSPSEAGVALVGHGTERHARSADSTVEHVRRLRSRGGYAEVEALFLDEDPHVEDLYDRLDAAEVVVVPLFVADGHHTSRDIPEAIDHPGVGESATIEGRLVHYAGAVGTEPSLADVIVERAVEAGATVGSGSARDGPSAPEGTFVRRVDRSPTDVAWGQLSIGAEAGGYELRHRDDAAAPIGTLEPLDRPRDLRERVRDDDRGRYRPLSGARTLPTGWVLPGLEPDALIRAIGVVYPASIVHWWSDRKGELDVAHFRETVTRQTGIYADLDGFDGPALDAAVEAVCGDCVRHRCWEAGPDEEIDADPGEGPIPCREACPFFLSAVHAFDEATEAGGVDPAGSVDPAVPVGAFEEPGNRYHVRFARTLARRTESDTCGDDAEPTIAPAGGENP